MKGIATLKSVTAWSDAPSILNTASAVTKPANIMNVSFKVSPASD